MKLALPKFKIDPERLKAFSKKIFQDKLEKTLQDLIELESENPDDMRVKQKLADILYKQGRVDEAIAKLKAIVNFYEKEDFVLKAIRACKNVLKIKPSLIDFNLKLASLYEKIGLINETANQFRIAINHFATVGDKEKMLALSQDLVKMDPSNDNRCKLAEIYQNFGMIAEAVKQYQILAKYHRAKKDYDKLLNFYELILPHEKDNKTLLHDVCILHLRKKRPDRALKILEHYKALADPQFADLVTKGKLMVEALKKQKKA